MAANFISLHPWCAVISEWNNTDDEEPRNKSAIVSATGSPYQNNEGPLQRDEVKATFNKEENNDNARKSAPAAWFLVLLHRRVPFAIFRTISTPLYSPPIQPVVLCSSRLHENWMPITNGLFFLRFCLFFFCSSYVHFHNVDWTQRGWKGERVTRFREKLD